MPLRFLGDGRYTARLVTDGLAEAAQTVDARTVLDIPVDENGGFVIELRR